MDRDDRTGAAKRPDDRDARPRYDRRSRSPPRRDRDDRTRQRSPYRARGVPPARGRSPPPPRRTAGGPAPRGPAPPRLTKQQQQPQHLKAAATKYVQAEDEDDEAFMTRVMGFDKFRTTKNTKVPGNDRNYGVNKVKKAEYRQYMNRVGGFNRPLSPSRG